MSRDQGFGAGGSRAVILSLLRDKESHAYDLAKEVERLSGGALPMQFGTLYPALYKMEAEGLVTSIVDQPAGERKRRVYRLTDLGQAEEIRVRAAWKDYAGAMDAILNRGG